MAADWSIYKPQPLRNFIPESFKRLIVHKRKKNVCHFRSFNMAAKDIFGEEESD